MTSAQPTAEGSGRCRYPGCGNPVGDRDGPGRRPGYCQREVAEDRDGVVVMVRHTALSGFRRRQQLAGRPDGGQPVTDAVGRAGAIRDEVLPEMTRLGEQLTAVLAQLRELGQQLAAAGDPLAAEAQVEWVRASTAARLQQARAVTAEHAAARRAAEVDAAEARAAAAEAITLMQEQAAARQQADQAAGQAAQVLAAAQADHAEQLALLRSERDAALEQTRRVRGECQAAAAALRETVSALREQLQRAETALERERTGTVQTMALLRELVSSRPSGAPGRLPPAAPAPASDP